MIIYNILCNRIKLFRHHRFVSAYGRNGKMAVDKFSHTEGELDVLSVLSCHVEVVCLLSKLKFDKHIDVELGWTN